MSDSPLADQIEADAAKAKMIETDGVKVQRRDLREEIAADKHLASTTAARSGLAGLQTFKINRPGAVE